MSYEKMSFDELDELLARCGFKTKHQKKGYGPFGAFLRCDPERFRRFRSANRGVPPEVAFLLRLMAKHGETAESVEAIPATIVEGSEPQETPPQT